MSHKHLKSNDKNLIKRYLIWCYKTTKEDLDRVDRYFTQRVVDEIILNELKSSKDYKQSKAYQAKVGEFAAYMDKKLNAAKGKKFSGAKSKKLNDDYLYLDNRMSAIEEAIKIIFGAKELKKINDMYEKEMTSRILTAREHT